MWLLYYCPLGAGDKIAFMRTPAECESSTELSFLHLCSIARQKKEQHSTASTVNHTMTYWAIQRPRLNGAPMFFATFAIFCTWTARIIDTATWTTEEFLEALQDILGNLAQQKNMQRCSGLPACASSGQSNILKWICPAQWLCAEAYDMSTLSHHCLKVAAMRLFKYLLNLGVVYRVWTHTKTKQTNKAAKDRNNKALRESSKIPKETINIPKESNAVLKESNKIPIPKLRAGRKEFSEEFRKYIPPVLLLSLFFLYLFPFFLSLFPSNTKLYAGD